MIILDRRTWWHRLWVWRGTALARIWPRLLVATTAATALTCAQELSDVELGVLTPMPFVLASVAVGIFLGFRSTASYDRFWEGRKLWGELANAARTWARQVELFLDLGSTATTTQRQRELVLGAVAFSHLLRVHLREERDLGDAVPCLPSGAPATVMILASSNRPLAALRWLGAKLRDARNDRGVDPLHLPALEATLGTFTNVLGACERIKNTPIPVSYSVLIHRIVVVYVFALPFGLVDLIGVFTPAVELLIAYAFLGLDAIGDELEHPFGRFAQDLPLSAIARSIEIDLREGLGDKELPVPLEPVDRVLW